MAKRDWQKVGEIPVDAGICWVGDPCYVVAKDSSHVYPSWKKFCTELDKREDDGVADFDHGVCVRTGGGDGRYEVFVKYDQGMIAAVKVVFLEDSKEFS